MQPPASQRVYHNSKRRLMWLESAALPLLPAINTQPLKNAAAAAERARSREGLLSQVSVSASYLVTDHIQRLNRKAVELEVESTFLLNPNLLHCRRGPRKQQTA
jgi:hypothetical protein